jgi:thiamine biosynthesis lipoprotein
MGTVVSFLVDPVDLAQEQATQAIEEACQELMDLDDRFSTWKPGSELSRWRAGHESEPSELMAEVIGLCVDARDITKGFFDPWAMPGGFDPTGLVKGWAAERALRVLSEKGVSAALVNAGGDICVLPGTRYSVGIRHPSEPEALCAVVDIETSVATSGIYERGDHFVNPFGGPIAAISATVVGGPLALADALATALAIGGTEVLYLLEGIEGVEGFYVSPGGSMYKTSGMVFSDVPDGARVSEEADSALGGSREDRTAIADHSPRGLVARA